MANPRFWYDEALKLLLEYLVFDRDIKFYVLPNYENFYFPNAEVFLTNSDLPLTKVGTGYGAETFGFYL